MKKYELKKCSAEFAWKERKEIKEGCTMYDVEPERLGEFESLEKAEEEKILEKALKDSESYDYGYQTVIIAGDRYEYGSDEDEIIVENAEVIGIV